MKNYRVTVNGVVYDVVVEEMNGVAVPYVAPAAPVAPVVPDAPAAPASTLDDVYKKLEEATPVEEAKPEETEE